MRKIALLAALALGALILGGCTYQSTAEYFDGAVIVEYKQSRMAGTDDWLSFRFYEEGEYEVEFSITPKRSTRGGKYIPDDRTYKIGSAPEEELIIQYILPDFLRITISHNGETESHDFS